MDTARGATEALTQSTQSLVQAEVDLYKQLFEMTGMDEYAQKAISAYDKVLDAQQTKNREILGNEQDALLLREKAEEDFADSLYGVFDTIVDNELDTAKERLQIAEDLAQGRLDIEQQSARDIGSVLEGLYTYQSKLASNVGHITGLPVGPSGGGYWTNPMLPGQSFSSWEELQRAKEALVLSHRRHFQKPGPGKHGFHQPDKPDRQRTAGTAKRL